MWARILHAVALALALALASAPAGAWVESTVVSDLATVDLERDGSARISHELLLRVRGGPLTALVLDGVDLDAEPAADGLVESVRGGATPIPLLLVRSDDGSLRLEIDHPKGLRSGSYLFRFAYRTRLLDRDLIRLDGDGVEVRWVGPRFADGIDSLKAMFRVPAAAVPPRLLDHDGELGGGVFLSSLRRGADKDELEIVRPHVAKGEPVVWRVWASAKSLDAFKQPAAPATSSVPEPRDRRPLERLLVFAAAALAALVYSSLVVLKARAHARSCRLAHARPLPLLPLSTGWRAAAAGLCLGAAVILGALTEHPGLVTAALLGAGSFAILKAPELCGVPRGPGRWLPLSDADAFGAARPMRLPGRWLDAGTWPGRLTSFGALAAIALAAFWLGRRSAYYGCLVALGAVVLVPIFLSGTRRELPVSPTAAGRVLLAWLAKSIRKRSGLKVVALARVPDGTGEADEVRLLIVPKQAVRGLIAVEVAVELFQGWGGAVALPCVLVRAREGSEAHASLPRRAVWTRGRKAEERVAVLRPALPTRHDCVKLVLELLAALKRAESHVDSKRRMSSGIGSSTSKPARVDVPGQASLLP